MRINLAQYIVFSFLVILILFSLTTYNDYRLSELIKDDADYSTRSTEIVRNSGRFQRNILTMVSGLRGYLLTGEKSFIDAYESASNDNSTILNEFSTLLTDSQQIYLLKNIKALHRQWTNEYTEPLKQAKRVSTISAANLMAFNKIYKEKFTTGDEKNIQSKLLDQFRDFTNLEYRIRNKRKIALAEKVNDTKIISYTLNITSIFIALIVVAFLVRTIKSRIDQMTRMAQAIAKGNYNVNIADIGKDELSPLGNSLNFMGLELSKNITLLQRSNEELDQFAHIVSHDLKGPLRGISNVVNWIEEDHTAELSPKVKEYFDLIKGRIHRAENLIEGLLSYARINKEIFPKEKVDINIVVHEVLENLSDRQNMIVDVQQLPTVITERILLVQIFSNLIDNAIKYNDKEIPIIKVYYKDEGGPYEFFVEDNGIGIASAYHKRIYDIFQTLADRDSFESTGVGLAIVRKILESKKQTIHLKSVPGEGSIFSFTWPKE